MRVFIFQKSVQNETSLRDQVSRRIEDFKGGLTDTKWQKQKRVEEGRVEVEKMEEKMQEVRERHDQMWELINALSQSERGGGGWRDDGRNEG